MLRCALGVLCAVAVVGLPGAGLAAEPQVGHMVFFRLKDRTDQARARLVAACDKHLDGHEGTVYYSAGVLAQDFQRDVNDRDWDVALHLVFQDKAAHDKYQDHKRHLEFIAENKASWDKVRVYDSYITPRTKAAARSSRSVILAEQP